MYFFFHIALNLSSKAVLNFVQYAVGQKSRKQKDANYRGVKSRASAKYFLFPLCTGNNSINIYNTYRKRALILEFYPLKMAGNRGKIGPIKN